MEILKLKYMLHYSGTAHEVEFGMSTLTLPVASTPVVSTDNSIIDINLIKAASNISERTVDLTDAAGHGVLVGTDKINMFVRSSNAALTPVVTVYITYRWKNVGLQEYIGIVQSMSA